MMSQIISDIHKSSVDFLKDDGNRRNLSIASGMLAAALTIAAIVTPLFPSLCIAGIVGIAMGLMTNETGKTLLKILDGGYQRHPQITALAAITSLVTALYKYNSFPAVGFIAVPALSMISLSLCLVFGGVVYEIGSVISDCLDSKKPVRMSP